MKSKIRKEIHNKWKRANEKLKRNEKIYLLDKPKFKILFTKDNLKVKS